MTDPFENEDASFLVLVNDEGQHSLWPEVIDVPPGWRAVFGGSRRPECLEYIEANWTDIRPASLTARTAGGSGPSGSGVSPGDAVSPQASTDT